VGRCLPTSEETKDPHKNPGEAAVLATNLVLGTYVLVSYAIQAFAGFGTTGIGLDNPQNANDTLAHSGRAGGWQRRGCGAAAAGREDRDEAIPLMRAAAERQIPEGRLLVWGVAATGVLVETLLDRGAEGDVVEAERSSGWQRRQPKTGW
jgi:hypothetical protein